MIKHLNDIVKNRAGRAIAITFACSGLVFGTWASFIPYIKEKFQLDEAQLGLLLLSMPVGILLVNPVSVILIRSFGAARTAMFFAGFTAYAFMVPVISTHIIVVVLGLIISGAAFGITNVSMNTAGTALEDVTGMRIISACHGMWSVGAMIGALLSSISLVPFQQCCGDIADAQKIYVFVQALFVALVIWWIRNDIASSTIAAIVHSPEEKKQRLSFKKLIPGKELWIIISICLCTYLTEGTITDWSSVYLREVTGASVSIAGLGFAVYAFFMASGRFLGDYFIGRYGSMRVLRIEGILVVMGLIIIIISPTPFFAIPGFMLTGAGISLASPILYQASAKVKGLAPGVGLATMNTFAMTAFLGGPVMIGFIAKIFNLRIAFALVAILAVVWILQTNKSIRTEGIKS